MTSDIFAPVAIVTGASRGIGAATVSSLLEDGYRVVSVSRTRGAETEAPGWFALYGDLADLDFARSVVDSTVKRFGRIDALINNAAWRELSTMRTVSIESWERTIRICLTTPAFLARWVAAPMEAQGSGVIVNVSSIQATRAPGMVSQYVAAKGGLEALTRDLAALYGPSGIRVVGVSPGTIATNVEDDYRRADGGSTADIRTRMVRDLVPLRRRGTPAEVAELIRWLVSPAAAYITGSIVAIDGGWSSHLNPYSVKHATFPEEFPVEDD